MRRLVFGQKLFRQFDLFFAKFRIGRKPVCQIERVNVCRGDENECDENSDCLLVTLDPAGGAIHRCIKMYFNSLAKLIRIFVNLDDQGGKETYYAIVL